MDHVKKRILIGSVVGLLSIIAGLVIYHLYYWNLIPKKIYTAEDFDITTIASPLDYNQNGRDDYTDILLGARAYVETNPHYDGTYYPEGYPPNGIGVCTDVIWNALKNAGYNLKEMMDQDISANTELYPRVLEKPNPNIDFRRVPNLMVFFQRYGESLTLDTKEIAAWQPGDIVTYGTSHIAIVSDKRNRKGIPYIIHNGGQPVFEEDALTRLPISGHYRFTAYKLPPETLITWQ